MTWSPDCAICLSRVIPINSEMNLAHQIRDVCTSLANVVTMVQNLTATVDKENLPARIVEFQKYHTDMVLGVQNRCKDGSVKMGILETIYTLEVHLKKCSELTCFQLRRT